MITYKNSAKDLTVSRAIELNKEGIALAVNDGSDITVKLEV